MLLARLLYRNLKGYRFLVVLAILITIAQVGCDLVAAMPLKFIPSKVNNPGADPACSFPFLDPVLSIFDTPLLDASLRPTGPNQPIGQPPPAPCPATPGNINSVVHPRITQHSVIGVIVFSILVLFVFGVLSAFLSYIELTLAIMVAQHIGARLREQLFDHLQRISLDWHNYHKKGDLVQRVTGNIADIEKLVNDGLIDLLAGSLTLLGVAIIMLVISVQYTIMSLTIAPLLFLLVFSYTGGIKKAARKKAKAEGKLADIATEDMNALPVIRAFTLEKRENQRFGVYVSHHRQAGLQAGKLQAQFTPLVTLLVVIGTMIVVGVGGYVAAGNTFDLRLFTIEGSTIDVGTLLLFLTYLKMLYQPMRDLSKLTALTSSASSAAERIQEVLNQAPEVTETTSPYEGPQRLQGHIRFENVFFSYIKERTVLKGISLSIQAGRKIALVGSSGSGKTTLVKLIPRFYETLEGVIEIDDVPLSQYPLQVLRQNISLVLQDSVLFEGTIRENIEIGRPGATIEQVVAAAKQANIHDVIMKLPEGYETMVREGGNNFSAGQRQRLTIARAMLRDAPILILDEPTANLDVEAEAEVMHALNNLTVGRTVLMVSHRLSTLGNVDEIIVMNAGKIAEQGTFQELKRLGGVFGGMLEEQNRYNLDRTGDEGPVRLSSSMKAVFPSRDDVDHEEQLEEDDSFTSKITAIVPVVSTATSQMTAVLPAIARSKERAETSLPVQKDSGEEQPSSAPQGIPAAKQEPAQAAYVHIHIAGQPPVVHPLQGAFLTIGRYSKSDIQLASSRVSRRHAHLALKGGKWFIEDEDSLNGLTWKTSRIRQKALNSGDRIYLDPTIILQYIEK